MQILWNHFRIGESEVQQNISLNDLLLIFDDQLCAGLAVCSILFSIG
jgi:hypothetical protein